MAKERFRLYAYDLNTNTPLTELPGKGLKFDSRLNEAGAISFSCNLSAPGPRRKAAIVLAYEGAPFALYVDYDGVIQWGGICWTTSYSKKNGTVEFGGKEFTSWGDQRVAALDYSDVTYPAGLDPAQLIYKIYTDAQNPSICGPGASIGLQVISSTTLIPDVIPGYPLSQHTVISSIQADMAQSIGTDGSGLDVTVTSEWSTDLQPVPINTLRIWSPRVGRDSSTSGLIFNLDTALDYSWPTDATASGNQIIATGAGNGNSTPTAYVSAPQPLGGLGQEPRLDKVVSFQNVQSQSQVALMANGAVQQYGNPLVTPTLQLRTKGNLGKWIVGDDARLYTPGDWRFPNGKDEFWRIVQQSVTVPDSGIPVVDLTFNQPPNFY